MPIPTKVVIGSNNQHKLDELRSILENAVPNTVWISPHELGFFESPPESVEQFETFQENAMAKAEWYLNQLGLPTIADDSGLCVHALAGRPGVHSRRWAGPDDAARNQYLLDELERVEAYDSCQRKAKFVCAMVFAGNGNEVINATGEIAGHILNEVVGANGFGYDPLFFVPEHGLSMATLNPTIKNRISHRAIATRRLVNLLLNDHKHAEAEAN